MSPLSEPYSGISKARLGKFEMISPEESKQDPPTRMSSADKLVRKSLKGTLGLGDLRGMMSNKDSNMNVPVGPATVDGVNYSEIINRSEQRSGLGRPHYN